VTNDAILVPLSILWLGLEIVLARVKRSAKTDSKADKGSLRLIWIVIAASLTIGIFMGHQSIGHIHGVSSVLSFVGLSLIVLGLVVRWIGIGTLRRHFTVDVSIQKDHRLIRTGMYRFVRHPAYTGSLLSFLGLGLSYSNYLSLLIVFVPICAVFLYRIEIEEKVLLAAFGEEYRAYCESTNRLIPGIY
jgi:protein-S-isoprenylcysteine O-methyltransferase Ste14